MKIHLCDESGCYGMAVYVHRDRLAGDHPFYFCNLCACKEESFCPSDEDWERVSYNCTGVELEMALQEARMEYFLYENRETMVFLGLVLSRMLLADLCLSSVAPSPIFAVVGRLAKERGIDLESLFTKMESLQVPPLTDGYNGSVLRS